MGIGIGLLGGLVLSPANPGADKIAFGPVLGGLAGLVFSMPSRGQQPSDATMLAHRVGTLVPGLRLRVRASPGTPWRYAHTVAAGDSTVIVADGGTPLPRLQVPYIDVYAGRGTSTRRGLLRGARAGLAAGTVVGALIASACGIDEPCSSRSRREYFLANVAGWTASMSLLGGLLGSYGRFDHWLSVPRPRD
jgi:hypothetical protein